MKKIGIAFLGADVYIDTEDDIIIDEFARYLKDADEKIMGHGELKLRDNAFRALVDRMIHVDSMKVGF